MTKIQLDERLKNDTYLIKDFDESLLLLAKNAHFPWFILVPKTKEIEFHKLDESFQIRLLTLINKISFFIEDNNNVDKINIATIGNVVSQMHIHIVGRFKNDICWPNVVWGCKDFKSYKPEDIVTLKNKITELF